MDTNYKKAANITVIVAGLCALAWLFFKYALGAVLPFILGAAVAGIVSSPAKKISKKTRLPLNLTSFLLVLVLFCAIFALIYFSASRLIFELGNLIERLSEDPELISRWVDGILEKFNAQNSKLGLMHDLLDSDALGALGIDIGQMTNSAVSSIASSLVQGVSGAVMKTISNIPSIILSIIVFFLSAFYFATDMSGATEGLGDIFPDSWRKKAPSPRRFISFSILSLQC
jgi:predicted PurR-regulated permease PerM